MLGSSNSDRSFVILNVAKRYSNDHKFKYKIVKNLFFFFRYHDTIIIRKSSM